MKPGKSALRVFVLEDDNPEREYLVALLQHTAGFQCVGHSGTARRALELLGTSRPEVVLVDLELPGLNGTSFIRTAKTQHPEVRFLVVTHHDSAEFLFPALAAGADGYLLKGSDPAFLLNSIRDLREGGAAMTPAIARCVLATFRKPTGRLSPGQNLSPREIDVLTQLTQGFQQKEIAANLHLSYRTIGTHLGNIYRKLHVHNAAGAVAAFLDKPRNPENDSSQTH